MFLLEPFSQSGLTFLFYLASFMFILIVFDILTRWLKGFYIGDLNSAKNFKGYVRKTTMIVIVFLFFAIDIVFLQGLVFVQVDKFLIGGFNVVGVPFISMFMILWICLGEVLSIIENLGRSGVPVPKFVKRRIKDLKDDTDEGKFK